MSLTIHTTSEYRLPDPDCFTTTNYIYHDDSSHCSNYCV